jgi:hypothetical protein
MIILVFTNDYHHLVWSGYIPAANDYIYLRGSLSGWELCMIIWADRDDDFSRVDGVSIKV